MILDLQMFVGWWQWQWQPNAGDDGGDSACSGGAGDGAGGCDGTTGFIEGVCPMTSPGA